VISSAAMLGTHMISELLGCVVLQDGNLESLDLVAASLLEPDPMMEKSRLVSRGFVHGRTGRWETESGAVASITIYEFAEPVQASYSVDDLHDTLLAAGGSVQRRSPALVGSILSPATDETDEGHEKDTDPWESVIASQTSGCFQVLVVTGAEPGGFTFGDILRVATTQIKTLNPS
jgi:hypothetical protein